MLMREDAAYQFVRLVTKLQIKHLKAYGAAVNIDKVIRYSIRRNLNIADGYTAYVKHYYRRRR